MPWNSCPLAAEAPPVDSRLTVCLAGSFQSSAGNSQRLDVGVPGHVLNLLPLPLLVLDEGVSDSCHLIHKQGFEATMRIGRIGRVMRLSKASYFADFVVYPPIVIMLIIVAPWR